MGFWGAQCTNRARIAAFGETGCLKYNSPEEEIGPARVFEFASVQVFNISPEKAIKQRNPYLSFPPIGQLVVWRLEGGFLPYNNQGKLQPPAIAANFPSRTRPSRTGYHGRSPKLTRLSSLKEYLVTYMGKYSKVLAEKNGTKGNPPISIGKPSGSQ